MIDLTNLFTPPTVPDHLQAAAEFMQARKNVIIAMPPRSGKTSMAVSYAQSLTAAGKKVLYITYNYELAKSARGTCGFDVAECLSRPPDKGYDAILVDDILQARYEAHDAKHVKMAVTWFDAILMSSACKPETRTIIIGSRWHENDFMGSYIKPDRWHSLDIPAIWKTIDRAEHSYWPEQYPLEDLDKIRKTITADDFKWLYQQGAA